MAGGWYEAGDFFDTLGKIVGGLQEGEAVALPRACVVVGGFVAIDICGGRECSVECSVGFGMMGMIRMVGMMGR